MKQGTPIYPLSYEVEQPEGPRNRLTTAFRAILAIPHAVMVGVPGAGRVSRGVFGAVATIVAVIAWFSILFTGKCPRGLWDLSHQYLRWRARAIAYMALLRDEYPPFGDDAYPVDFQLEYSDAP